MSPDVNLKDKRFNHGVPVGVVVRRIKVWRELRCEMSVWVGADKLALGHLARGLSEDRRGSRSWN